MFDFLSRHRPGAAVFVLVALISLFSVTYYLLRGQKRVHGLYVPKLLMLRIDEVPFPKNGRVPVNVMAGMPVSIACENISPPEDLGKAGYRFRVGGFTLEPSSCTIETPIPGDIGSIQTVSLDYLLKKPDGSSQVIDHWQALVRPVPAGPYVRIHTFETREARPVQSLTVPIEVVPFVEAAVKLQGDPKEYAVLFFVEPMGTDLPVLQVVARPRLAQKFEVVTAQLKRYRIFGPELEGYAAWPNDPIQIGSPDDERKIFTVYAGIFKLKDVPSLVGQMLSFEGMTVNGQPQIKVQPKRLEDIRKLAWQGWISEPLRVVRAPNAPGELLGPQPKPKGLPVR